MKISYNWLKTLIQTDLKAEEISPLLTDCGLEVENIEYIETVQGGLKGVVIGEVIEKVKHPDADRLSLTKVNIGTENLLSIVCGAPNVAAGQKVIVATVGTTLYPSTGEPIQIKKSKIRGAVSEGMICAEDEIGLGVSHDGIMVLPDDVQPGLPAADFFKLESDVVFEIGLTPNRSDAASHLGVARDLAAVLNSTNPLTKTEITINGIYELPEATGLNQVEIVIENQEACKRYSGLVISGITVADSPEWMQNRLKSIGLRPINNVVDITNYVLHELGQPLHAFDFEKIAGHSIRVKTCKEGTLFKTLDDRERKLSANDLMICNENEPMCIAGVFGGVSSGVTEGTKTIFLESAFFNSTFIRKTSKLHDLKTDASFRFERGTDPEMTVTALKRAALLILEICGGTLSMDVKDIYPEKLEPHKVAFSYNNCTALIGKNIDKASIKNILLSLGITILQEGADGLLLSVPLFKTDVTREVDVIEEVMRIYGYNHIEINNRFSYGVQEQIAESTYQLENLISDVLIGYGFNEMMSLSLSKEALYPATEALVKVINPLSQDLNVLRGNLLYSGLEAIAFNCNRKNQDLKLYEWGKVYSIGKEGGFNYCEQKSLALFLCGKKIQENPYQPAKEIDFVFLKAAVERLLLKAGIGNFSVQEGNDPLFAYSVLFSCNNKVIAELGAVAKSELKKFDIAQSVFYANIKVDILYKLHHEHKLIYSEIPKFPSVRRDLAMLLDKNVKYEQIKELAFESERKFLKEVNLFDIYEGEKIEAGKKSYAVSFTLLNEESTLTDKQIENIMNKLITTYKEKLNADLR